MASGNYIDIDFTELQDHSFFDDGNTYILKFENVDDRIILSAYLENEFLHSSPLVYGRDVFYGSGLPISLTPINLFALSIGAFDYVTIDKLEDSTIRLFTDYEA